MGFDQGVVDQSQPGTEVDRSPGVVELDGKEPVATLVGGGPVPGEDGLGGGQQRSRRHPGKRNSGRHPRADHRPRWRGDECPVIGGHVTSGDEDARARADDGDARLVGPSCPVGDDGGYLLGSGGEQIAAVVPDVAGAVGTALHQHGDGAVPAASPGSSHEGSGDSDKGVGDVAVEVHAHRRSISAPPIGTLEGGNNRLATIAAHGNRRSHRPPVR